ncbi:MAG TPA: helix-hairpin-helix domain-containing protein [Pelolinea sp.]|nr:helix-hairpin-helix domain-containing protein [Pelolinea sp.]
MSRELWIGVVIGLIIGWLAEWVIDRFYWRKRITVLESQLANKKDDLTKIKGVGPVIEERLNKAGIFTFRQVSKLTREEIERFIGDTQNLSDEKDLIKRAKKLAKKAKKK